MLETEKALLDRLILVIELQELNLVLENFKSIILDYELEGNFLDNQILEENISKNEYLFNLVSSLITNSNVILDVETLLNTNSQFKITLSYVNTTASIDFEIFATFILTAQQKIDETVLAINQAITEGYFENILVPNQSGAARERALKNKILVFEQEFEVSISVLSIVSEGNKYRFTFEISKIENAITYKATISGLASFTTS